MSHTEVKEIADKKILDVAVEPVNEKEIHLAGKVAGNGSAFAVAHYGSNNMITLRYRLKELKVQATEKEVRAGRRHLPGRLVHRQRRCGDGAGGGRSAGTDRGGLPAAPAGGDARSRSAAAGDLQPVERPATQDVGWVRYAFDKFEVPYELIYKERDQEGRSRRAPTTSSSCRTRAAAASGSCSTSRGAASRSNTRRARRSRTSGCTASRTTSPAAWGSTASPSSRSS